MVSKPIPWGSSPPPLWAHSPLVGALEGRGAVLLRDPPLPSRQRPALPGLPPELPVPGGPREEDPQPRQPVPVRQSGVSGLRAAAALPRARAGGRRSPLPAGEGALRGGLTLPPPSRSILTLSDYVSELGHPYVWVQKLGGLHFPKDQPQARLAPSLPSLAGCRAGLAGLWGGFGGGCVPPVPPRARGSGWQQPRPRSSPGWGLLSRARR